MTAGRTVGTDVDPATHVDARGAVADAERAAAGAERAAVDAERAAQAARVQVVEAEGEQVNRLVARAGDLVWGPGGTFAPNELRALSFAGNPVHLALDRADPNRPVVGFAVGFVGWSPTLHVHSHQVGVMPTHRRRGIGLALKLAQRVTGLQHDVTEMRWTFDPLVRRNTAFNLGALGARAPRFHPDFYGKMDDVINAGDSSDRLEAVWDLRRPLPTRTVPPAPRPDDPDATDDPDGPVLLQDRDGRPVVGELQVRAGAVLDVPTDYEAMRAGDPGRARQWRTAVREVLEQVYGRGFRIGAVDRAGYRIVGQEAI